MIIASLYPCPFEVQDRHEFSASIIKDDEIYAYEEAKLTTVKNEGTVRFPERSLMMGCRQLGIVPAMVDRWVFPTPSRPIDLDAQHVFFSWLFKAYKGKKEEFAQWYKQHVCFVDHQLAHAALAVLASNFQECAFVCQDGGGDFGDPRDFIFGEYKDGKFEIKLEHHGLNTICSFHAFITDALAFSGGNNGKVSGLAAYGSVQKDLAEKYLNLLKVNENGIDFRRERYAMTELNVQKADPNAYDRGKIICRYPSDTNILRMSLEYLPMDLAATGEFVVKSVFRDLLGKLCSKTSQKKLVLCGGLFQNVPLNYSVLASGIFEDIYIPMAPSDAGLSLGQALYIVDEHKKLKREDVLTPFLGPSFQQVEIQKLLDQFRLNYTLQTDIAQKTAELIAQGHVVGWFQGRGEYGPRSLGARSILADPRRPSSKTRVNQLLKKRDWFMPYAPSILEEYSAEWVKIPHESRYMQLAFQVREDKIHLIPAAVHVDGSSRMHVVRRREQEKYWRLIEHFRSLTGIPLVLNTSFNRHGISTIATPRQAVEHLLEGCMDYLAIDDFLVDFSKNRIAVPHAIVGKPESVLLRENCIERLKDVFTYGDQTKLSLYLTKLSELLGIQIQHAGGQFFIEGEGGLSLSEAICRLVDIVNRPLNV